MGILKYFSLLGFIFLCASCYKDQYTKYEDSFFSIYLREWKSTVCPKKIIYEKYVRNTNFKKLLNSNSGFDINSNCHPKYDKLNRIVSRSTYNDQMILTPYTPYIGKINYDIRLVIDDSIEFKITYIQNKTDTISEKMGPRRWAIMNNISSLVINGYKLDNTKAPFNIDIPTKLGRIIKK